MVIYYWFRYRHTKLSYLATCTWSRSVNVFQTGVMIVTLKCNVLFSVHVAVYTDCQDALIQGQNTSGVYTIKPDNQSKFSVYCDMDTDGGGWTVFQRREGGSVDFDRYWIDYQQGFGNISRTEFWLGLEKIHRLTASAPITQLRVDLQDFEGDTSFAKYTSFSVGDSSSQYRLSVTGYNGTAGNSLIGDRISTDHNGQRFSTKDRDNDAWHIASCADRHRGGWWFHQCMTANLNGLYYNRTYTGSTSYPDGIIWTTWRGRLYSLKFAEMKLRRN